jgi:hypothetical protein
MGGWDGKCYCDLAEHHDHIEKYMSLVERVNEAKQRRNALYRIATTHAEYPNPSFHKCCSLMDDELYYTLVPLGWYWAYNSELG